MESEREEKHCTQMTKADLKGNMNIFIDSLAGGRISPISEESQNLTPSRQEMSIYSKCQTDSPKEVIREKDSANINIYSQQQRPFSIEIEEEKGKLQSFIQPFQGAHNKNIGNKIIPIEESQRTFSESTDERIFSSRGLIQGNSPKKSVIKRWQSAIRKVILLQNVIRCFSSVHNEAKMLGTSSHTL